MAKYCKCWLGIFLIFQGIGTSIAKKPYIFVIFQGGPDPGPPSGSAHRVSVNVTGDKDKHLYMFLF